MLFDGVFAIAMTILVIEIRVPDLSNPHSPSRLLMALLHDGPSFLSWALSFAMLGLFWLDAQRQYHHIARITTGLLAVNLFLMATAAFFPFCAALLGRYPTNPATILVYITDILLYRVGVFAQWRLAERAGAIDRSAAASLTARFRARNARALIVLSLLLALFLALSLTR